MRERKKPVRVVGTPRQHRDIGPGWQFETDEGEHRANRSNKGKGVCNTLKTTLRPHVRMGEEPRSRVGRRVRGVVSLRKREDHEEPAG